MHIPTMQSLRILSDPQVSGLLEPEDLYDLILESTGDIEQAQKATSDRQWDNMRRQHEREGGR